MDRLKTMRQRDWARVFGFACAVVGLGLSIAGYPGAQWDALILVLGALMLLRAAVEAPSPSRVAGLMRAGRVILFMFAFASVNRAQDGLEGAVSGALGNWILWAVAALLLLLPLVRKGLAWGDAREAGVELLVLFAAGLGFWLLFGWMDGGGSLAALHALVAVAALANGDPIWRQRDAWLVAGVAFGLMLVCIIVPPGSVLWPVAAGVVPIAIGAGYVRRTTSPRT